LHLLVNPTAGRGSAGRRLGAVARAFGASGDVTTWRTAARGDESALVRRAVDAGCTSLAVLGGDGTISKAASALIGLGAPSVLVPVAAGTGNDFVKNVGLASRDLAAMVRLAVEGGERRIDAGIVEGRYFLNAVGFGFDAAVVARMEGPALLRGTARYVATALRLLLGYRGVTVNGELRLMCVVANGPCFGGAFRIAPAAAVDDGRLDLVTIGDADAVRRAQLFMHARRGAHGAEPEVQHSSARAFTLAFPAPPEYQLDGDLVRAQHARLRISLAPNALRVVAPR